MGKKYGHYELKKIYHISGLNTPKDLMIEITESKNGCFVAKANYKIFSYGQAFPYKHDGYDKCELSAVHSVLNGFESQHGNYAKPDEFCWVPVDNPNNICILGTGVEMKLDDFEKLKSEHLKFMWLLYLMYSWKLILINDLTPAST